MSESVDATFYAQVEPEFSRYYAKDDVRSVIGAKVVRVTQSRPAKPQPGTLIVKLALRLPNAAFMPLSPEAVVIIPASLTEPHPVVVEALDPHRPEDDS